MYDIENLKESIIFFIGIFLVFLLGIANYNISVNLCKIIDIPFDLSLLIVGAGFGLDLTIVLTLFETIIIFYLFKFIKNKMKKVA